MNAKAMRVTALIGRSVSADLRADQSRRAIRAMPGMPTCQGRLRIVSNEMSEDIVSMGHSGDSHGAVIAPARPGAKPRAQIVLRPATIHDAADMAILDNLAGHGLPALLWQAAVDAGEADDAFEHGRALMADPSSPYGYANAMIAQIGGRVAGASSGYVMTPDTGDAAYATPAFAPVIALFRQAAGDWLVDSLAVFREARGMGVGAALLDNHLERARAAGCRRAALVTEDGNAAGLALYRSRGFEIVDSRLYQQITPHFSAANWLLLKAELDSV
jgi:ribosomal protein S18 acetylase RimI-like enzyme